MYRSAVLQVSAQPNGQDNLTVGLCGDLKYGRTVHSILKALSCYKNNKFILISTPSLALPQYIKDVLHARGCEFKEAATIEEAIGECDMLYMTRIQQERFASREEYEKQKGVYILTREKMQLAKKNMIVMHPLPRVNEIEVEIDDDPRAAYFRQAKCGMYGQNGADTHDAEQHDHRKSAADWSGPS